MIEISERITKDCRSFHGCFGVEPEAGELLSVS